MARRAQVKVITDHDEIRRWAEERGAIPSRVHGTEGSDDVGIIRLAFPGAPGARDENLEPISWDEWFREFDQRGLALVYEETTASGKKSNFNKVISRETAAEELEKIEGKTSRRSGGRKGTGKRLAVAVAAGRLRSNLRQKSASRKASSGTRAASTRKKATKTASGTRAAARKSQSRATASTKRSSSRKTTSSKPASNVRSISSARGSARSSRTASARGREGGRSSNRRAA